MLSRIIFTILGALAIWAGHICMDAGRFGPMFTGSVLIIIGVLIVYHALFQYLEQIVNNIIESFYEEAEDDYD